MNLNAIRRRVEALEKIKAMQSGDSVEDDLLSPRDVSFLITEQRHLEEEGTIESRILSARIDDMLQRHRRALKIFPRSPLPPHEVHEAVRQAAERSGLLHDLTDDERQRIDAEQKEYRRGWLERLGAEREYIREVLNELDSLKG